MNTPILDGVVLRRLCLACAVVSIGCAALVICRPTPTGADRFLFDAVIENRGQFVVDLARFIVPLGEILPLLVLAMLCSGSLLIRRADPYCAALVPMSLMATGLVTSVLKDLIDRSGPAAQLRRVIEPSNSFPSGHAALSAAVLVSMGMAITAEAPVPPVIRRAVLAVSALLAVAVSWSTVALHMHWPSDAIGGSALGAGIACAVCLLVQSPSPRRWISARRGQSDHP